MNAQQQAPDTVVVEARQLSKAYGRHRALHEMDLEVRRGESLAIIGHNGAGKTTLLKLILGLTNATSGSLRVAHRGACGYLPENVSFPDVMTAQQVLGFYARLKNVPLSSLAELLSLVGLSDHCGQKVRTFSKGMRQRLGLAQALLGAPPLLILDEPTSGLDPLLRRHFYDILRQRQRAGAAIIMASHALTEVEASMDRVAIFERGRLLVKGSLPELRARAGLPTIIRVSAAAGQADALRAAVQTLSWKQQKQQKTPERAWSLGTAPTQVVFDICCPEPDKLAVLYQVTAQRHLLADIEVIRPSLEQLYRHFTNGGTAP